MTVVAVHQPNYLPWLGYFAKIAAADLLVFLDDAQFSKNSIINRVKIGAVPEPRWLTVPVAVRLGQRINEIRPSQDDWAKRHISVLYNTYRDAAHFKVVWPVLEEALQAAPRTDLAAINQNLVEMLARRLELATQFKCASALDAPGSADDRLVAIVSRLAPGGTYLSGRGAMKYQDPEKFTAAGLRLVYSRFEPPVYTQGIHAFQPGLSVVDALFHTGWKSTAVFLRPRE